MSKDGSAERLTFTSFQYILTMNRPRSLQDIIKRRQQSEAVGRADQLGLFRQNIALPVNDERRRFIFNISGQAGVGKTFLVQQFRSLAEEAGSLTAYTDETEASVLEVMDRIAAQFQEQDSSLKGFTERHRVYRQKRQELEADPEVPKGLSTFLGRNLAKTGVRLARRIPVAGAALDLFDEQDLINQFGDLTAFIARKLTNKDEVQLLLEPIKVLTPLFLTDLNSVSQESSFTLIFDTYEHTSNFLDPWLRDLLEARYGTLPADIAIVIVGQHELNRNRWGRYKSLITHIPLEPFTDEEAREYLTRRGIKDERVVEAILHLSGRLPLLIATLAAESPDKPGEIEDPSDTAIDRFLKWVDDPTQRKVAVDAALPRFINRDIIAVLARSQQTGELFTRLTRLPFIKERAHGWVYHQAVREPMLRRVRRESPSGWEALHGHLAAYYEALRDGLNVAEDKRHQNLNWQRYALESLYHRLCQKPHEQLLAGLKEFVSMPAENLALAFRWAVTIQQAGMDAGEAEIQKWGGRLAQGIRARVEKQHESAIEMFTSLLDIQELQAQQRAAALGQRADLYLLTNRHSEALADQTEAIRLDSEQARHWSSRGFTNIIVKDYESALRDISRAIELRSEWLLLYLRVWIYIQLKRFDEAVKESNSIIENNPDKAEALSARGYAYLQMGRYEDALADFDQVTDIAPNTNGAFAQRGFAHLVLGQYQKAITDFNRAIEIDENDALSIHCRGLAYLQSGKIEEALADFDRHADLDADAWGAYAGRGEVYRRLGKFEEALADHDRAIELQPDNVAAHLGKWHVYVHARRYDEALASINHFLGLHPDDAAAVGTRGEIYLQLECYGDALADFNRVVELSPDNTFALSYRGHTYSRMGRYDEALADFNRALDLFPDNVMALTGRGAICLNRQDYDSAIKDFTHAIGTDTSYVQALALRAQTYNEMDMFDEALVDYNRLVELDPTDTLILRARGISHLIAGRFSEAIYDLSRVIELDPNAEAFSHRGIAYSQIDRPDEALSDLNRAVELAPEDAVMLYRRGGLYSDFESYDEALDDFSLALRLDPNNIEALCARGDAYMSVGLYEESLEDLTRAIELDADNVAALHLRGEILRLIGNYSEAIAEFSHALELDPEASQCLGSRGAAYAELEHYDEALADLSQAIEMEPDNDFVFDYRGTVYLETGRYDEALADFSRAIELDSEAYWYFYERALTHIANRDSDRARADLEVAIDLARQNYEEYPDDPESAFDLALFLACKGEGSEAKELCEKVIAEGVSSDILEEVIENIDYLFKFFPNHLQAKSLQKLLSNALKT